jgi:hypothetical protein
VYELTDVKTLMNHRYGSASGRARAAADLLLWLV